MTVLKELVARLGFEVDKAGFLAAEKGVAGIQTALRMAGTGARAAQRGADQATRATERTDKAAQKSAQSAGMAASAFGAFAKIAATAGLTTVLEQMVHMASDANETGNILEQVFGADGAAQVKTWAETSALAMGRSKYALRDYAGRLGAVIDPMVQNKQKAQEMSTTLTGLAVDLGSFFNATDEDAMMALRSGLTGEYESLKRFGVVLNDTTLAQYAHTQGLKKKITTMSIAEKTELRYGYILQATKNSQGDAARTSEGFANSMKALKSAIKDMATDMGMAVLPKIEKLIHFAREGVARFKTLTQGTFILQAAMYTLSGVAAMLALSLAAPFILPAVAVLALILLVDELHALFTGGRSVIGEWLDEWKGIGTADALVQNLKKSWDSLIETFDNLPDVRGSWELLKGVIYDVGFAIQYADKKLKAFLSNPAWEGLKLGASMLGIDAKSVGMEGGALSETGSLAKSGLLNMLGIKTHKAAPEIGLGELLDQRQHDRFSEIQARMEAEREERKARAAGRAQAAEDATMSRDTTEDYGAGMSIASPGADTLQFGRARVFAPKPPPSAPAAGGGNMSVNVGGTSIVVNTNDPEAMRRVAQEVAEKERRATAAAIANMSGG